MVLVAGDHVPDGVLAKLCGPRNSQIEALTVKAVEDGAVVGLGGGNKLLCRAAVLEPCCHRLEQVGGIGLIVGIFLGIASIVFAVPVDEKEAAINEVLPAANCGGCGYSGCSALAAAIVKGEAPVNACVVGCESIRWGV